MDLEALNWDDVRVFVAMARSSSLRQAAEKLGLTHPTVRRRLNELEAATGLTLFHRRSDGLHPTLQGQAFLETAKGVEAAMQELARRAQASDPELRGPVRVTLPSVMAQLLAPDFAVFAAQWPHVQLIVNSGAAFADLGRMEADVAIRVLRRGRRPDEHLAGRLVVTGHQAAYGDPETGRWISSQQGESQSEWAAGTPFPDLPVGSVIEPPLVRHAACAAGMGLAILPCVIGDPDLPRCSEPAPDFDIWVLVHPDLRRNPRLRLFRDSMVTAIKGHEKRLRGEA